MSRAAWIVLLLLLPMQAAGQSGTGERQDTSGVVRLDRLRITVARGTAAVTRLPAAVAAIDATDIRDGGQATMGLDESLDRVPGIFINNRYNLSLGSRISIRGLGSRAAFGVRGIRVITDGIPLTMPDGQTNLNNLDLASAGRIDVLRGPASALYGNAAGGVISVETAPAPSVFSTELRALAGDGGGANEGFGSIFKLQGRVGGPLSSGGFTANLSRTEADGYREFSRGKQSLLNVVARHPLGTDARVTMVVNAIDAPVAESPGALPIDSARVRPTMAWPNNVRTGSGEATRQLQVGIGIAHALGANRLDIMAYGLGREVDNALPFGFIDLSRRGGGLRVGYTGTALDGRISLASGVDLEWLSDERQEFDNVDGGPGDELRRDQRDQVSSVAPFAQALVALTPRLEALVGARFDAVRFATTDRFTGDGRDDTGDRTLSAASPMIGLAWALTDALRVYGNVATAFQTPTTTELINAPPPVGLPCCPGGFNVALEPQRATSFEAGLRGSIGRFSIDLAAYHMTVRNTIVPFQVPDGDGREFFRNAGESRHRGLELSAGATFGRHQVTFAWTLNDFVFTDDGDPTVAHEGNRLPGVPRHHLFAGLRLRPLERLRLDLELEHTGSYFASDANEPTAVNEAATILDLRLAFDTRIRGVAAQPFLSLNNLTNQQYYSSVVVNAIGRRYYEPAPRRNLHLGVSVATGAWSRP